jgi:hypothetical protein
LQITQVGAQNQKATGLPANADPSKAPPPRSGAVNLSNSGTAAAPDGCSVADEAVFEVAAGDPQPITPMAKIAAAPMTRQPPA